MLRRCYDLKNHGKTPSYAGCSVSKEWHVFSEFKKWMQSQYWQGMQLDKDLLVAGNKTYSSQACAFVSAATNTFTNEHIKHRGQWPIGVYLNKKLGKLVARCNNPFTGKMEHLGCFTCPHEAHEAWRKRKHELALQLAALQTDPRVSHALSTRYLKQVMPCI
jgi:hypothetical protein